MKKRKIWVALGCAFVLVCLLIGWQTVRENQLLTAREVLTDANSPQVPEVEPAAKDQQPESSDDAPADSDGGADDAPDSGSQPDDISESVPDDENGDTFVIDPATGMDRYNTEPVPEGKPLPVEWQDMQVNGDAEMSCTLSVTCNTILDNLDNLNPEKSELIPEDGVIFAAQQVTFYEGETVFNVLLREMKKNKIHMEFVMTPLYNSNYIEGIGNLYEFDCGELSGWMYKVNGWTPNYGCSRYKLSDGDVVEWQYTCDLGRDIGSSLMVDGGGNGPDGQVQSGQSEGSEGSGQ